MGKRYPKNVGQVFIYLAHLTGGGGGNRTRVRKPYTARTTCLARSFGSRLAPAGRQADAQPVASTDPHGQATRPWERLM